MTWSSRTDTRKGDKAHGIQFFMLEREPQRDGRAGGECSVKDRKVMLDGKVSLTLATGQDKYGDELIAQIYTQERPRVEPRRSSEWSRVQVYLGPADEQTAAALEMMARQIRRHLEDRE